jgi:hypothetical protein
MEFVRKVNTCIILPLYGLWQSYIYDMSIWEQAVSNARNESEIILMPSVIFCYKFAVDIEIERRILLFLFRTSFIFQVPQDIVV